MFTVAQYVLCCVILSSSPCVTTFGLFCEMDYSLHGILLLSQLLLLYYSPHGGLVGEVVISNIDQYPYLSGRFLFFAVGENLWQWLWIDQICIGQSAIDERSHQAGLMPEISSKSSPYLNLASRQMAAPR